MKRSSRVIWWLLAAVFILSGLAVLKTPEAQRQSTTQLQQQLRLIIRAMAIYDYHHDSLPYSEQGSAYALYLLRPYVDDGHFEWDDKLRRLNDWPIEYLNANHTRPHYSQILCMSKPTLTEGGVLLGTGGGLIFWHNFPQAPDSSLLGSWHSVEGFFLADLTLVDNWCQTHPMSGVSWQVVEGPEGVAATASVAGRSIRYVYADKRLAKCIITTSKGVIEETVTTDRFGRILGVSREPANWMNLLPDCDL